MRKFQKRENLSGKVVLNPTIFFKIGNSVRGKWYK